MPKYKYNDAELPEFEIVVNPDNDNEGLRFVSLVKDPAIDIEGMYFDKENGPQYEGFKSIKDKQIIVGPAMVPFKRIPRLDPKTQQPYNVFFSPDTILGLVEKFNSQDNNRSINIDHTNEIVNGYIQQNWIVQDSVYDASKYYGFNLQPGTWFIVVKILDQDFWNKQVKEEGRFSFSIEGMLDKTQVFNQQYNEYNAVIDNLKDQELIDYLLTLDILDDEDISRLQKVLEGK